MKNLFYLLSLLVITFACVYQKPENEEIKFINNAVGKAKVANKLLIIEFGAPQYVASIRLKHDIFENGENSEFLDKNFVMVKVSPSDSVYNALCKHFNLEYQSSVIIMDKNGNEIDRAVNYDGNRDAYFNFLKEVSEGKNLYGVVFSTYKKDTMNINSNYILAKKLLFRYQIKDAINHFNRVLLYDPENKSGYNTECKIQIAGSEMALKRNLMRKREFSIVQKSTSDKSIRVLTYSTEAWIHYEPRNKEKAIQLQNKAIELYPHPSFIQDLEKFNSE